VLLTEDYQAKKLGEVMPGIISAIRGGPDSQPTIEKAITFSKENNLPLYFLYVVNLDFLARTETSRTHFLSQEMNEMGEFILLLASARAKEQKVSVKTFVRQGEVKDQLIKLCHEVNADYVVMGQPRRRKDTDLFTSQQLKDFVNHLETETGASVILVEMGA
jgi:nucleotide-binding universal stress UspA family protein